MKNNPPTAIEEFTESADAASDDRSAPPPLRESAQKAIDYFLEQLDGQPCSELHDMVMAQVEEPLLRAVMAFTSGNQSKAAEMLGLNRGTLRTKLRRYGLMNPPSPRSLHRN